MIRSTTEIWENFSQEIRSFISRRVADPHDVDDLLQDVFVKIHTHMDRLQEDDRLLPWLYRIVRNTVIDYYRTRHIPVDLPDTLLAETEEPEGDPANKIAAGLRGMIDCLPEKYRQAVTLAEIQGLKQQDLADQLGISLSGAKSRVQRGRKLLREVLLDCCHFEFDRRQHVIEYAPRPDCCRVCQG